MTSQSETIAQAIERLAAQFEAAGLSFGHGTDNAVDDAAHLVLAALRLPPQVPPGVLETPMTPAELGEVEALAARRLRERVPTAYLVRTAWFCGLRFHVDERVLVPRSPIAELIENGFAPWIRPDRPVRRILDVGTGSGCIAVACAYAFPDAEVDAADVSEGALAVARENIAAHRLEGRVHALRSDVYEGLGAERYDIIVSNPPYVDAEQMRGLPEEYRREPALGLAGGADGLDVVLRILAARATACCRTASWWWRWATPATPSNGVSPRSRSCGWSSSAAGTACSCSTRRTCREMSEPAPCQHRLAPVPRLSPPASCVLISIPCPTTIP